MQVAFYLAGEITQVKESICARGLPLIVCIAGQFQSLQLHTWPLMRKIVKQIWSGFLKRQSIAILHCDGWDHLLKTIETDMWSHHLCKSFLMYLCLFHYCSAWYFTVLHSISWYYMAMYDMICHVMVLHCVVRFCMTRRQKYRIVHLFILTRKYTGGV